MPYILKKTNGNIIATVDDASLDLTTNLTFVGRNYAGYGETVNENFVKLLESFSNNTRPTRPIMGQLWFDNTPSNKRLNICYDGTHFKSIANMQVQDTPPNTAIKGDLWWDSVNSQLKTYDGASYLTIGPQGSVRAYWINGEEISTTADLTIPVLKGYVGKDPIAILSLSDFTPAADSALLSKFAMVKTGITLSGADAVTGSSKAAGYYLWGTAAEALVANTATTVKIIPVASGTEYLTFVSGTSGSQVVNSNSNLSYDVTNNILNTVSSAARYADLAERYESDMPYETGTVMIIGGSKEVTTTTIHANTAVAGIVSKNPAYMMNSEAGTDETHPYIALKGRVPCKIEGQVKKGDLLVTSSFAGYATVMLPGDHPAAVIGKALGTQSEGFGIVEVLVV